METSSARLPCAASTSVDHKNPSSNTSSGISSPSSPDTADKGCSISGVSGTSIALAISLSCFASRSALALSKKDKGAVGSATFTSPVGSEVVSSASTSTSDILSCCIASDSGVVSDFCGCIFSSTTSSDWAGISVTSWEDSVTSSDWVGISVTS